MDSIKSVLTDSDIKLETSTTTKPVVKYDYIKDNVHIVSIGAHRRDYRALDDDIVKNSSLIVVDSRDAVYEETGDIYEAIEKNIVSWDKIIELGELTMNINKYKHLIKDITVYKSVGVAIEDACASALFSRVAEKKNIGLMVSL